VAALNFKWKKFYVAAFFAQQAAEKALKAVYIKNFGKLIKTHDLFLIGKKSQTSFSTFKEMYAFDWGICCYKIP
jgi:HEPN domain-containing protein